MTRGLGTTCHWPQEPRRNQRVKALDLTLGQDVPIRYRGNYVIGTSGFNVVLTLMGRERRN